MIDRLFPFYVENNWLNISFDVGWGNGYIAIPPSHPWFGKDYDELNQYVDIHGGLTFGKLIDEKFDKKPWIKFKGCWVVGFDTTHSGDNKISCNKQYVLQQTISLLKQAQEYDKTKHSSI